MDGNKHYATVETPLIAAVMDGLLRLESLEQVADYLANIAQHHIVAAEQLPVKDGKPTLTLWIQGYDITEKEKESGATGNFAVIGLKKMGARYSLTATKLVLPPAKHPQRKYVARGKHPNWAHPLLKAMRNGKMYASADEAHEDLARLHRAFPTATIPTRQKLYAMVYSRGKEKGGSPITKYVLEPKVANTGMFYIDISLNTGRAKGGKSENAPMKNDGKKSAQGVFTAREQLRQRKKKAKKSGS